MILNWYLKAYYGYLKAGDLNID